MNQVLVFHRQFATGTFYSDPIQVPLDWESPYVDIMACLGPSMVNIFDVHVNIEVFEDGQWKVRDRNTCNRSIGQEDQFVMSVRAQIPGSGGKQMRATFALGQGVLHIDIVLVRDNT